MSDLDVAGATKEDLNELEERLTARIDRLGDRIDEIEERLTSRIERSEGKIRSDVEAMISQMEKRLLYAGIPCTRGFRPLPRSWPFSTT